jgi:hypothetical protein
MTRLLLLTCDGSVPDGLVETVAERASAGPVEARILLPLAPVPDAWTWDEDATRNAMLKRMDEAIGKLRSTGAQVEGTIGCDRDAMVCVNWVMERERRDAARRSCAPAPDGPGGADRPRLRDSGHAGGRRPPGSRHGLGFSA